MKILAPAKINLALDVLRKDSSGYHEIQTVFHEAQELHNEVEITESPQASENNDLAHLAFQLIKRKFQINKNVRIHIKRNIPPGSGLGGESSNAAAVLKALNKLWELNLSSMQLQKLAAEIGMDVPFFIIGGTAFGENFGEKITPLTPVEIKFEIAIEAVNTPDKTQLAYQSLDLSRCGKNLDKTKKLLKAIENRDHQGIIQNLHNDFETEFIVKKGQHLSGSGPSTFSVQKHTHS